MTNAPSTTPDPVLLAEIRLATLGVLPARRAVPVHLEVAELAADAGALTITDAEGAPIATLTLEDPIPSTTSVDRLRLADGRDKDVSPKSDTHGVLFGTLSPTGDGADGGAFASLRLPPEDVALEGAAAIVGHDPVDQPTLDKATADPSRPVLFIVLDGPRAEPGPSASDVTRSVLAIAHNLQSEGRTVGAVVVPAPQYGDEHDDELADQIATAYGAKRVVADRQADRDGLLAGLDGQGPVPDDDWPEVSLAAWRLWHPPRDIRGLVLFFTGLSGSGKSTVARAVVDHLAESTSRSATLLDGDVVRRNLSAGLGFSREDRDRNIERIGFVAAEIARHGGLAVCAPIAPFAATRARVRAMAEAHADFVLVHVATPLEECERRDRKGLYARARRGEIPDFTGISSPYEAPDDADVMLDTSTTSIADARDEVLAYLRTGGWLASD